MQAHGPLQVQFDFDVKHAATLWTIKMQLAPLRSKTSLLQSHSRYFYCCLSLAAELAKTMLLHVIFLATAAIISLWLKRCQDTMSTQLNGLDKLIPFCIKGQ